MNGISAQTGGGQEINLVTNEVVEKQINLVPSSTNVSFAVLLNIKFTIVLIRM
jgi:hypothetical protein